MGAGYMPQTQPGQMAPNAGPGMSPFFQQNMNPMAASLLAQSKLKPNSECHFIFYFCYILSLIYKYF